MHSSPTRLPPCAPACPFPLPACTHNPPGSSYPTRDENGNLLQTEYGKCRYKDNQVIGLQELPETAPPGQLPHSGARVVHACVHAPALSTARRTHPLRHSCCVHILPSCDTS